MATHDTSIIKSLGTTLTLGGRVNSSLVFQEEKVIFKVKLLTICAFDGVFKLRGISGALKK